MRTSNSILFLLLSLFLPQYIFAQEYKDCETAYSPCGESPFYVEISPGEGTADSGIENTCIQAEFSSTWITWTVIQGGALTFVLTPDQEDQDLDFAVFKFNTGNNCADKEMVRCMASGENVGQPNSTWEICTGPTGLAFGETDVVEYPGCAPGDNNFLAPLECNPGDSYVMLVNDFSNTASGFSLSFGGTAVLDCITIPSFVRENALLSSFELFPSPSNGILFIEFPDERFSGAQLMIYDLFGRLVYTENSLKGLSHPIDLTTLPNGSYVATIRKEATTGTKRFVLLQ